MSFNIPSTRTFLSQGAIAGVNVSSAIGANGSDSDSRRAPAYNKIIQLGNFSSIMDSWLVPVSEGVQSKDSDTAGCSPLAADRTNTPSSPRKSTPSSPHRTASPRKSTAASKSASSPRFSSLDALDGSPYKDGFMKGFTFPSISPHSGSTSSTPLVPDIVSEGDCDSEDDDDSDAVSLGSTLGGLRLISDGETELKTKQIDAQWTGSEIKIASASTSPATAMATARAAVRAVTEDPSFANRFSTPTQVVLSPRPAASNITMLSRQAYPGQPSPVAVPISPRRVKLPSVPHHKKTIPEKLHLAKSMLHQEYKLDQKIASTAGAPLQPVHVIVDMSNIVIGFYENTKVRHKLQGRWVNMPFSFEVLSEILLRGRSYDKFAAAGSTKDATTEEKWPSHMRVAKAMGYDMNVLGRVKNQDENFREQGVDELLHLKMCHSILDYSPATLILATGDANVAEFSDGFLNNVKRALKNGWRVELYSWKSNIARAWKDLQREQENPDNFRIIDLDKYLDFLIGENPAF